MPSSRTIALGILAITLLTVLAYFPVLTEGGFIWDDDDYLTKNRLLHDLPGLARIWTPRQTHQYYPLVFTTFWLEYQIWELNPLGYHLVNVIIHIANALLLWRVMHVLRLPLLTGWLIAAVFALHPVHVESVAWITERKNVLSGLFYLLAALAYFRFDPMRDDDADRSPPSRTSPWFFYALSLLAFVAALLSKSVTCSLPAALILVMLFRRQRLSIRRLLPLIPFFIVGVIAALHTAHLEKTTVGASGIDFDLSFIERCLIASKALLFYPFKLLIPWPVMFVYPRWSIDAGNPLAYWSLLAVAIIGLLTLAAYVKNRRAPFIGLAYFAGTVFPAIGFFNVFPHRYSFVADHFQYLASIGVIALVIGVLTQLLRSSIRLGFAAAVIVPILFFITLTQSSTYQSAETVWRDTLRKNDTAFLAHTNLANILLRNTEPLLTAGRPDRAAPLVNEARSHAQRSIELDPESPTAHATLSEAMRMQVHIGSAEHPGLLEEALIHQQTAIDLARRHTGDVPPEHLPPIMAGHYFSLGRLLELLDRPEEAADAYHLSLRIVPENTTVLASLANLLVRRERLDEAVELYLRLLSIDGNDFAALGSLASVYERRGDYRAADAYYRRALDVAPGIDQLVQVVTRLIRLLADCPDPEVRNFEDAVFFAERLADLSRRRDPAALLVLSDVYFRAGRPDDAVAVGESALTVARQAGLHALARQIEQALANYASPAETPGPDP